MKEGIFAFLALLAVIGIFYYFLVIKKEGEEDED